MKNTNDVEKFIESISGRQTRCTIYHVFFLRNECFSLLIKSSGKKTMLKAEQRSLEL